MTSLRALLSTLASQVGPVLTVYSKERVEFNGPVLARWFSKISNLLSEELGADLFGEGEAHSGRFFIRHELWQEIVWTVPLLALGWTRLGSLEDAAPGDLLLVSTIDEDVLAAYESGATVLAQPREYLAFSWRGDPLPDGIFDALAEVMAQPDLLIDAPTGALVPLEEVFEVSDASEGAKGVRVGLYARAEEALTHLIGAWRRASGVVLIDPDHYTKSEAEKVSEKEGKILWI